jgi:tol-pal system protein YbgF
MKKVIVLFLVLLLTGIQPVFALSKSTKLILNEIEKLAASVKQLENRIDSMEKRVQIVNDIVGVLARNNADSNQNQDSIGLSLQFIKEEINELKNKVTQLNDRLLLVSRKDVVEDPDQESESGQDSLLQSPENIYYTSYSDYLKKNYDLAIKGFEQFIRLFPKNGLSDNSLYWIGECYYSQKMYQDAANTFNRLINEYRDGDKIPAAMLKKGFALIEMGNQNEGTTALKQLISTFPLSEEASLAQQKIREILE